MQSCCKLSSGTPSLLDVKARSDFTGDHHMSNCGSFEILPGVLTANIGKVTNKKVTNLNEEGMSMKVTGSNRSKRFFSIKSPLMFNSLPVELNH